MQRALVSGLLVRPHAALDDGFVARLSHETFGPYAKNPIGIVSSMIDEAHASFVATLDKEPVGFAILRIERRGRAYGPVAAPAIAHLDAIAVSPRLRKRGIASALLDHVEHLAATEGALGMFLLTAARNGPARTLFEACGYQYLAGYRAAYLGRHAGVIMTKALAP